MPRIHKDYKPLNLKIDRSVADVLEIFIQKTGLSKTATVERALKEYIHRYEKTGRI